MVTAVAIGLQLHFIRFNLLELLLIKTYSSTAIAEITCYAHYSYQKGDRVKSSMRFSNSDVNNF